MAGCISFLISFFSLECITLGCMTFGLLFLLFLPFLIFLLFLILLIFLLFPIFLVFLIFLIFLIFLVFFSFLCHIPLTSFRPLDPAAPYQGKDIENPSGFSVLLTSDKNIEKRLVSIYIIVWIVVTKDLQSHFDIGSET